MQRKFFSVLGIGDYQPCFYEVTSECETRYVQEALIKDVCSMWNEKDEIVIFLTKEAKEKHWFNEEIKEQRLSEILRQNCGSVRIKDIEIPSGKNEDEIWSIFEIILNNINDEDEITFDITHSFRSIPMLVLVVLNYAKAVKNIKLNGIYYGAYDARTKKDGQEVAPVFNLTSFDSLLEWSEAVNLFLKYGNSEKIKELSSKELIGRIKEGDKASREIRDFVIKLNDFTNDIFTCRGKVIESSSEKSIATAYGILRKKLHNILDEKNNALTPLKPLFSKIIDRISEFSPDDNLKTGMAVIKWSIDNNLIQQGYTALDETIKTYLCQKYGLDDSDYNNREKIINNSLNIKSKIKIKIESEEHRYFYETKELVKKIADDWNVESEYKNKVIEIASEVDEELMSLFNKIRITRNDINHFGFEKSPKNYNKMKSELNKCYCTFKKYIEKNTHNYKE